MSRAPKNTGLQADGMSWLALAPFPAFNPLNWWALTNPRNVLLASLNNTQLALDAWRAGADSVRALIRLQQDEMLKALQAQAETQAPKLEAAADAAESASEEAIDAPFYVRPMIEATRAYSRVGRAFIVAQRDTLRAFSGEEAH